MKLLFELSLDCIFLKTSTGTTNQGATLPTLFTLLTAIKESKKLCGLKVSGGIKTAQQAFDFAQLAQLVLDKKIHKEWFRIGASTLLNKLK